MASYRRHYFVYDDYGDIWNVEPFSTFGQAHDFRGAIVKDLYPRVLKIRSILRGVEEIIQSVKEVKTRLERHDERSEQEHNEFFKEFFSDSDF